MAEKIINVQDAFLNYMRKNKIPVTIFLLNGVKISGIISCFDHGTIVVKRDGYTQLIYKHAISTFSPHGNISVFDWNGPQPPEPPKRRIGEQVTSSSPSVVEDEDEEFDDDEEYDLDEEYDDDEELEEDDES
jgi:host factor-I protein